MIRCHRSKQNILKLSLLICLGLLSSCSGKTKKENQPDQQNNSATLDQTVKTQSLDPKKSQPFLKLSQSKFVYTLGDVSSLSEDNSSEQFGLRSPFNIRNKAKDKAKSLSNKIKNKGNKDLNSHKVVDNDDEIFSETSTRSQASTPPPNRNFAPNQRQPPIPQKYEYPVPNKPPAYQPPPANIPPFRLPEINETAFVRGAPGDPKFYIGTVTKVYENGTQDVRFTHLDGRFEVRNVPREYENIQNRNALETHDKIAVLTSNGSYAQGTILARLASPPDTFRIKMKDGNIHTVNGRYIHSKVIDLNGSLAFSLTDRSIPVRSLTEAGNYLPKDTVGHLAINTQTFITLLGLGRGNKSLDVATDGSKFFYKDGLYIRIENPEIQGLQKVAFAEIFDGNTLKSKYPNIHEQLINGRFADDPIESLKFEYKIADDKVNLTASPSSNPNTADLEARYSDLRDRKDNDSPHKVLGVSENALPAEVQKAYRKLAAKFHPDKHFDNPDMATQVFGAIKRAKDFIDNNPKNK